MNIASLAASFGSVIALASSVASAQSIPVRKAPTLRRDPQLVAAADSGNLEKARALLAAGVDPLSAAYDSRSRCRVTALHQAAWRNDTAMAKLLLEAGASVNTKTGRGPKGDPCGGTPLTYANEFEMFKLLLDRGASVNVKGDVSAFDCPTCLDWTTPLTFASSLRGEFKLDQWQGPKFTPEDALRLEARNDSILLMMIEHGADLSMGDYLGRTALDIASYNARTSAVRLLLAHGAAAAIRGKSTPLMMSEGCPNPHGYSPLTRDWRRAQCAEVVQLLLKAGIDVNARNSAGTTALHMFVGEVDTTMTRILLDAHADANLADSSGATPLLIATKESGRWGTPNIVHLLIDRGADVNARAHSGSTPLRRAVAAHAHQVDADARAHATKTSWQGPVADTVIALLRGHGATLDGHGPALTDAGRVPAASTVSVVVTSPARAGRMAAIIVALTGSDSASNSEQVFIVDQEEKKTFDVATGTASRMTIYTELAVESDVPTMLEVFAGDVLVRRIRFSGSTRTSFAIE